MTIFKDSRLPESDEVKQQHMLVYLFRNWSNLFTNKFKILMIRKKVQNQLRNLFLIPLALQSSMLNLFHSSSGTFHLGQYRTKLLCQKYFDFYNLEYSINEFINSCKQCKDGKKIKNAYDPGLGQTSTLSNERLHRFSMDIVNMPPGTGGMKFLLTIIDLATSWIEVYPLRNAESKTILGKLENDFLPRFSSGLVFLVDGRGHFTSK